MRTVMVSGGFGALLVLLCAAAVVGCAPKVRCEPTSPYFLSGYRITVAPDVRRVAHTRDEASCADDNATSLTSLTIGPTSEKQVPRHVTIFLQSKEDGYEINDVALFELRSSATSSLSTFDDKRELVGPGDQFSAYFLVPNLEVISCQRTRFSTIQGLDRGHSCTVYFRIHGDLVGQAKFLSADWPPSEWDKLSQEIQYFIDTHITRGR